MEWRVTTTFTQTQNSKISLSSSVLKMLIIDQNGSLQQKESGNKWIEMLLWELETKV